MVIYLLHFTKPLERHGHGPAGHYLGSTEYLDQRLEHHRRGTGARITRAAVLAGSKLKLARKWKAPSRQLERKLKNYHNSPALCPICNPDTALNHMNGDEDE